MSNYGEIRSTPRRGTAGGVMKGHVDQKGYINITLRKDGMQYT